MSNMIPEDKILEVKNSADILEIISETVILKKAGTNHVGLCPFHSEKTPSFMVNPQKQIFKCFGCNEGGNVFSFLMKKNGLSFPEAVRLLAGRYGVTMPSAEMTPAQKVKYREIETLVSTNELALSFFRHQLTQASSGRKAMEYLEKRGFSRQTIDRYSLGFAPEGWDHLASFMRQKKVSPALVQKAGLIIEKDSHRYYDRFRERIIFPIFSMSRQVLGFGGRIISNRKNQAKYLNSPETPLYHKKKSLYGIHAARDKARETDIIYVVEGYFDLLALHQHGILNAVATLGTALTPEHVDILKGCATRICLVYDSDQAGLKAAERGLSIFQQKGMAASVIVLPAGQDPDSFIFQYGAEAFHSLAQKAMSAILFLIHTSIDRHGLSIEGKLRVVDELSPTLSGIDDIVARAVYVKELSEKTGIDEGAINKKIAAYRRMPARPGRPHPPPDPLKVSSAQKPVWPDIRGDTWRMERHMITMVLQFPESIDEFRKQGIFDYLENKTLRHIGEMVMNCDQKDGSLAATIIAKSSDGYIRKIVADLAMGEENSWVMDGCIQFMNQFKAIKKRTRTSLSQRIKMAEADKDDALLESLLKEKNLHLVSMKKKQYIAGPRQ